MKRIKTFENFTIKNPYDMIIGHKYKITYPNYDDYDEGLEPEISLVEIENKKMGGVIVRNIQTNDTYFIQYAVLNTCEIEEITE